MRLLVIFFLISLSIRSGLSEEPPRQREPAATEAEAGGLPRFSPEVKRYLDFIHDPADRLYEVTASDASTFREWQVEARLVLKGLLRLDDMEEKLRDHHPSVRLGPWEDMGGYSRTRGEIRTEPEMSIPFWLMRPDGEGPFPVGIFVHGHSRNVGMDEYAGIPLDEENARHIRKDELDVGLRGVRRGFLSVVPAIRGFKPVEVPDLIGMYQNKPCRSHSTHCLMAGRTAFGERIWDIQRLLDYVLTLPEADSRNVLLMGHSGGGGLVTFGAAVDPRFTISVCSGWYDSLVDETGKLNHCECNTIPGLLQFGEVWDIAGLIAPRPFLVVSGTEDLARRAHDPSVVRAVTELKRIYGLAGSPQNFEQAIGIGGHKFFNELQWPFVTDHLVN